MPWQAPGLDGNLWLLMGIWAGPILVGGLVYKIVEWAKGRKRG